MDRASGSAEQEVTRLRARLARERSARRQAEVISEAAIRRLYAKQAELELLETVATASNEAASVEEALGVALRRVCAHTGWPVGHGYLLVSESDPELVPTTIWQLRDPARFQAFRKVTEATRFQPGVGLPGRVLATAAPAWIIDVTTDLNFPRAPAAAQVGLRAAFAFPMLARGEVVGVLEFFATEAAEPDQALLELMAHVGTQVGRVVERKRAEERLAEEAAHDSLTGLPNRRRLAADIEKRLSSATNERPLLLVLFDLDGFKAYNDSFGHPAGDALLSRLGRNLAAAIPGSGSAYRMGGDEFCVLASLDAKDAEQVTSTAAHALCERGEGFAITASYGSTLLPADATQSSEALRLADQRMYAQKSLGSRASAGRQSADVLLRVLSERNPDLGVHLGEVAELCRAVAARLLLPDEELAPLLHAAALHDVGKVAIPDQILNKPGPLDDGEWAFMRRHTLIGERILSTAPALVQAAKLVRSTHEWFDGQGYPDQLAGEDIPLGARIIAVCDAFDAMTAVRPYRPPMSRREALAELRRCAGTQFDPMVVDAFCAALAEGRRPGTVTIG
jgi:two-component system cell cycle response regulator